MSNFLTSKQILDKFNSDTKLKDYGLSLSPLFIRVGSDKKTFSLIIVSIEHNKKANTAVLKDVFELDVFDGSIKTRTPAQRYYTTLSKELGAEIPCTRPNPNKELFASYRQKTNELLDKIRTDIAQYLSVYVEDYSTYLKYTLYPYTDLLADTFVKLSRTTHFERESIVNCNKCGTSFRANTSSCKDGDRISITCNKCSNKIMAVYNKKMQVVTYEKIYENIRTEENTPKTVTAEPQTEKRDAQLMDSEASYTVSTNATLNTQESPQIKEITAKEITEEEVKEEAKTITEEPQTIQVEEVTEVIPEAVEEIIVEDTPSVEPVTAVVEDTPIVEAEEVETSSQEPIVEEPVMSASDSLAELVSQLPPTFSEEEDIADEDEEASSIETMYDAEVIEALRKKKEEAGNNKKEETVVKSNQAASKDGIIGLGYHKKAFPTIKYIMSSKAPFNHVFGLKGNVGCGIDYSLREMGGYKPEYVNNKTEFRPFSKCVVIDISDGYLVDWIRERIIYMRKFEDQIFFLRGNAGQWEQFLKNEPILASYITEILSYQKYSKEELYNIYVKRLGEFGMKLADISEETKTTVFGSKEINALKVTKLAARTYFRAKANNGYMVEESELLKAFNQP